MLNYDEISHDFSQGALLLHIDYLSHIEAITHVNEGHEAVVC